jgi:HSP20 family protein
MAEAMKDMQKKEAERTERAERTWAGRVYSPQVDILERSDDIVVMADMPGVDEESVDINLEKNVLSIYGRADTREYEAYRPVHAEYGLGDYQRVFTLSEEIDRDRIQATVKNGVLKVILPKSTAAKARKIVVKAEA